jgi:hypothetical protein
MKIIEGGTMTFDHYGEIVEQLDPLLEEWNVRSNLFYKLVKDHLASLGPNASESLRKKALYDAFDQIRNMGITLDEVHTRLQELGRLYNKIWDLVKDT